MSVTEQPLCDLLWIKFSCECMIAAIWILQMAHATLQQPLNHFNEPTVLHVVVDLSAMLEVT